MEKRDRNHTECGRGEQLVSVLYGEATPIERAEFEAHARDCASCRDELAAFRRVREDLRGWEVGAVPAIKVEVRPSFLENLRRAFAALPAWGRLAAAGACALVVLAALNTRVSVGPGGVSFQASLLPTGAPSPSAPAPVPDERGLTAEQVNRLIADRCDELVRERLEQERAVLVAELDQVQRELATAQTAEMRQIAARLAAQRRKIDDLQRDLDRQAGYGGADLLFSAVAGETRPGS
jgi:hypothetical protein